MTQVVVQVARAGDKCGSVELVPFCDRDKCDATVLVSKDDAFFIDCLMKGQELTPPTPAKILYDVVAYIGGRFSEVGVGPETGSLRVTFMSGDAVGILVHPGFALQIALLGDLPLFYGEEEKEAETETEAEPEEEINENNVREKLIAAMEKRKMGIRRD